MTPPSQLLLITGAPASGKSRLAVALAARYRAACCSKDEIKELLFEQLGSSDAAGSRRLSNASFALLFAYVPRLLTPGALVLLEGNFRPGEHEAPLQTVLSNSAVQLAQVLCEADAATRAARLTARALDPSRHAAHRDADSDVRAKGNATYLALPGLRLRFDGDSSWERQYAALCERLDPWCGRTPRP